MKSWYTIRARASGTEVLIYDEIGAYGVTAKGFLAELGWRRLRRGQHENAREIAPIYLKKPDGS